jgi:transcriptional regulator with XRE-family HTH domain
MEASNFAEIFAHRVRRRRQVKGLTQKVVADAIGMRPANYSRLEKGEYQSIQLEQLYRLVQTLETSADYLLSLSDDQGVIPPILCPRKGLSFVGDTPSLVTASPKESSSYEYNISTA